MRLVISDGIKLPGGASQAVRYRRPRSGHSMGAQCTLHTARTRLSSVTLSGQESPIIQTYWERRTSGRSRCIFAIMAAGAMKAYFERNTGYRQLHAGRNLSPRQDLVAGSKISMQLEHLQGVNRWQRERFQAPIPA